MALSVSPPPKRNRTPQSVCSATCFQFASPSSTTDTAAASATTASGLSIASAAATRPPNTQPRAAQLNTAIASMRGRVHGMYPCGSATCRFRLGGIPATA